MTIRYVGNSQDGYTAIRGGHTAQVKKGESGWEATYAGRPTLNGSCACPTIKVPGSYASRKRAAEMALAEVEKSHKESEWKT